MVQKTNQTIILFDQTLILGSWYRERIRPTRELKKIYRKINGGQNKMGKKEENKRKDTGGGGREKIRKDKDQVISTSLK